MTGFVNDKAQHYTRQLTLTELPVRIWRAKEYKKHPYFYMIRYQNFKKIDYVEEKIIKFAKRYKNFYIVLNNAFEGYAYTNFWYIQKFIKNHKLENKIIYLCGHLDSEKEYISWCKNNSIVNEFKVVSYNIFFNSVKYEYLWWRLDIKPNISKWFCCLNHRPHPHRVAAVTYLDHLKLIDDGIVTLHEKNYEDNTAFSDYSETVIASNKFWSSKYSTILKKQHPITEKKLPLVHDNLYLTDYGYANTANAEIYNSCLINLITETYYLNIWNFNSEMFLTEKTLRAILSKQIFIIIGPKGILKKIKSMGFKTFDDFFDESYDMYPDESRAFKAIDTLHNIIKTYDINEIDNKTAHVREYNLKVLMESNFNINLKDMAGL